MSTRTVLESRSRTAVIGFEAPFCVIGERINPTGRKTLAAELVAGDFTTVDDDTVKQVAAGAQVLDVNAGVTAVDPNQSEPALLAALVQRVQERVDVPLCIDSSVAGALAAALAVCEGRPLVNSVTGEEERLESVLPLVRRYHVPVVGIANDESGISMDPDVRFDVARKIVQRAADHGIPAADVVIDPLVMPIGALGDAGRQVFRLCRRLREELRVNTVCGASNVSFGLPCRHGVNAAFLPMAIASGLTSAIMNPCRPAEMQAVRAANVLTGADRNCSSWIRMHRAPRLEVVGEAPRRRSRRRAAAA